MTNTQSLMMGDLARISEGVLSTSNEYSGLISFRMDWFDLLTVQGTLKSLVATLRAVEMLEQNQRFRVKSCSIVCTM